MPNKNNDDDERNATISLSRRRRRRSRAEALFSFRLVRSRPSASCSLFLFYQKKDTALDSKKNLRCLDLDKEKENRKSYEHRLALFLEPSSSLSSLPPPSSIEAGKKASRCGRVRGCFWLFHDRKRQIWPWKEFRGYRKTHTIL